MVSGPSGLVHDLSGKPAPIFPPKYDISCGVFPDVAYPVEEFLLFPVC